jgi:hypothetical protein
METLYKYHDGTILVKTDIQHIIKTPIWKGNRILDTAHVDSLRESLKMQKKSAEFLDSGYYIIRFSEKDAAGNIITQEYLIDGQHRQAVARSELESRLCVNFPVTCRIATVYNEADAICLFNAINNSKPIQFKEDLTQIINRYIEHLVNVWGTKRMPYIRSTKTTRPYCFTDDIRKELAAHEEDVRRMDPADFMAKVQGWNGRRLREIELELTQKGCKDSSIKERAVKMGWALGVSTKFGWIAECLSD